MTAYSKCLRVIGVALVVALSLAAAGCSKSSKPTTTTDWANGLCSSITTWKSSISAAASSIKSGNVSKSSLQTTVNNVKSATSTFESSVKKLGKPPTKAGAQAQQSVQQLSTEVGNGVQSIETAIDNASGLTGVLSAVSVVSGTLVTMGTEVSSTVTSLQQLDPSGELTTAFKQADNCSSLISSTG